MHAFACVGVRVSHRAPSFEPHSLTPLFCPAHEHSVANKKVSAACFTNDGRHVIFADKFGDVSVATTAPVTTQQQQDGGSGGGGEQQQQQEPAPLLGHTQAIVTSCLALPGDRLVVTTDRDAKVRVSALPAAPLEGSYEIQAYCLGHREFAACATAVPAPAGAEGAGGAATGGPAGGALLLSGGGDGAVMLWDPVSGARLGRYAAVSEEEAAAAAEAQAAEAAAGGGGEQQDEDKGRPSAGEEETTTAAEDGDGDDGDNDGERPHRFKQRRALVPVVAVAVAPGGGLAAVVVEGGRDVQLLRLDHAARALGPCVQRLALPGDLLAPCRVAFDDAARLWVVGGPPVKVTASAHVAVAAPGADGDGGYAFVTPSALPAPARAFLERRSAEEEAVAAAAAAAGVSYTLQLRKRRYDPKEIEERKVVRTDKFESERLARMRQREAAAAAGAGAGTGGDGDGDCAGGGGDGGAQAEQEAAAS